MADSKEETGKGPSRPYATLDLKATEVGAKPGAGSAAADKAPPASGSRAASWASLRDGRTAGVLLHAAAGLAGGALALLAFLLFASPPDPANEAARQVASWESRLRALEGGQARVLELPGRLETLTGANARLESTQGKLASELKAMEERVGSAAPDLADRLGKLETAVTSLSVSGGGEANEVVRAGLDRFQRDLAAAKADVGRLGDRLDRAEQQLRAAQGAVEGVKAELERGLKGTAKSEELALLLARVDALDKELQGYLKREADRSANTSRVVLSLELSNLKRAIERGDSFAAELAAVKRVAGDSLNLTPLARYAGEGLPPVSELAKSFRQVANAMRDAEAETRDAPLFERLLSGARSIVRIRKSTYAADDGSLDAMIARMELALKENRLSDLLAEAKKLPPKAALAGEDWLRRLEMRRQVEQALAETEAALKSSLAASPAATDRRQ
jgi:hypothetical protein